MKIPCCKRDRNFHMLFFFFLLVFSIDYFLLMVFFINFEFIIDLLLTKYLYNYSYLYLTMKYSELAGVYEQLEKTSKRLEKTEIISELLKKTSAEDLEIITLLIEGRIFPNWDEREIGVASRSIIKAISAASGISTPKVEDEWRKAGDLGIVAERLIKTKKQTTLHFEELTVKKVFDNLRKLAELEGLGTVDRKIQLIAELLTSAKPNEARYIVRATLQELRVGVGAGSLRDAICWAFFSDKFNLRYEKKENNFGLGRK